MRARRRPRTGGALLPVLGMAHAMCLGMGVAACLGTWSGCTKPPKLDLGAQTRVGILNWTSPKLRHARTKPLVRHETLPLAADIRPSISKEIQTALRASGLEHVERVECFVDLPVGVRQLYGGPSPDRMARKYRRCLEQVFEAHDLQYVVLVVESVGGGQPLSGGATGYGVLNWEEGSYGEAYARLDLMLFRRGSSIPVRTTRVKVDEGFWLDDDVESVAAFGPEEADRIAAALRGPLADELGYGLRRLGLIVPEPPVRPGTAGTIDLRQLAGEGWSVILRERTDPYPPLLHAINALRPVQTNAHGLSSVESQNIEWGGDPEHCYVRAGASKVGISGEERRRFLDSGPGVPEQHRRLDVDLLPGHVYGGWVAEWYGRFVYVVHDRLIARETSRDVGPGVWQVAQRVAMEPYFPAGPFPTFESARVTVWVPEGEDQERPAEFLAVEHYPKMKDLGALFYVNDEAVRADSGVVRRDFVEQGETEAVFRLELRFPHVVVVGAGRAWQDAEGLHQVRWLSIRPASAERRAAWLDRVQALDVQRATLSGVRVEREELPAAWPLPKDG